ncbi:MAG TPA: TIGR04255 family protein [Blastocatellia bacterium]|nr:TIGR04255 family protein [Blastocatellia bacterium]
MPRRYSNPPLIEAVCEFRLSAESKWDLTVPGLMYERLRSDFPNKEQRVFQEVQITQGPEGLQQRLQASERILLLTSDKNIFIQLGPRLLAVNCLKPYPTWEGFMPRIDSAFDALRTVVEIRGFQRVALRYVNRIELPASVVNLEEYFEFGPMVGDSLMAEFPRGMADLTVGCVFSHNGGGDQCKVQLITAAPDSPGNSAFLLDLDYFTSPPRVVKVDEAVGWVVSTHEKIERVFEGCITQRLRDLFGEVK